MWGIALADDSTYVTCKGATTSQITCTGPHAIGSSLEVLQAVAVSDSGRAVVVGTLTHHGAADVYVDSNIFLQGGFTGDTSVPTGCGVDNFRVANVPGTKI